MTPTTSTSTDGLVNGDTIASETVPPNATSGSAANYTITYAVNQWGLTIH